MARKKHHPAHENHERWLVSYADFITLLFAFFVVMFASSQTDKAKAKQVSDSVKSALENGGAVSAVHEILGGTIDEKGKGNAQMKGPGGAQAASHNESAVLAELLPSMKYLSKTLEAEIHQGKVEIHLEPRGLVVSLRQATFFPSGEDAIDPATYTSIEKIAKTLRELSNSVRLEGHTDSVPIHTARFRSNWELSAARGISMMELLETRFGISRNRMAIGGYADTAPVEPNDTEVGRRHNRRVDIVILNQTVVTKDQPAQTAANVKPDGSASPTSSPKVATP
jgi:chemotaxis protein MotB